MSRDREGGMVLVGKPGGLRTDTRPGLRLFCREMMSFAMDMGAGTFIRGYGDAAATRRHEKLGTVR